MEQVQHTTSNSDSKAGQLKAILYLLQTNLEEFKEEVDRSYELLKVGERTDLTKHIEGVLTNPVDSVFNASKNIDSQIKHIVDIIVKSFLVRNKELVSVAYRSKTNLNDLHYSIVLKEDNMDNRNKIFDFFDKYDLLELANRYPVYFQFVPAEFIAKMNLSEELKLD